MFSGQHADAPRWPKSRIAIARIPDRACQGSSLQRAHLGNVERVRGLAVQGDKYSDAFVSQLRWEHSRDASHGYQPAGGVGKQGLHAANADAIVAMLRSMPRLEVGVTVRPTALPVPGHLRAVGPHCALTPWHRSTQMRGDTAQTAQQSAHPQAWRAWRARPRRPPAGAPSATWTTNRQLRFAAARTPWCAPATHRTPSCSEQRWRHAETAHQQ